MKQKLSEDKCFQCGKPRIITNIIKEKVNGSIVKTVETICSDPDCQKRTSEALNKEIAHRMAIAKNKEEKTRSTSNERS